MKKSWKKNYVKVGKKVRVEKKLKKSWKKIEKKLKKSWKKIKLLKERLNWKKGFVERKG